MSLYVDMEENIRRKAKVFREALDAWTLNTDNLSVSYWHGYLDGLLKYSEYAEAKLTIEISKKPELAWTDWVKDYQSARQDICAALTEIQKQEG